VRTSGASSGVNDPEWMAETLRRHERALLLYAAKVCGNDERARDVVQETFLELCSAEKRAVEGHLAQWLFTVCRNKALDCRRKDEAMKAEVLVDDRASAELDPSSALARGEEEARVLDVLARLPGKQQEVLRLKFQGGLSYKEIAAVTGESVGNVGFLIHVALKGLRDRMAVEGKVAS
jgi:RNA polymerase sigma factor (sigma-70 family)